MKISSLIIAIAVVSVFSTLSYGAIIKVVEYEDRVVVEIDGSMDPRLAGQVATQSVVVTTPPQVVESKTVVPQAAKEIQPAKQGAEENVASAKKQMPTSTVVTAARSSQEVTDLPVPTKYPAYNRAEQIMAYMEKLPKRNDFVEGRLETRQTRWNKKLNRNSGDTIQ